MISVDIVNLAPNRDWAVWMVSVESGIWVELFLSEDEALYGYNMQASGMTDGFGTELQVVLEAEDGTESLEGTWSGDEYHLLVSGEAGDEAVVEFLPAFWDLDGVEHALYANEDLRGRRARAEVNAHTYVTWIRGGERAGYFPDQEPGVVVDLESSMLGVEAVHQVHASTLVFAMDDDGVASLVTDQELRGFAAMARRRD